MFSLKVTYLELLWLLLVATISFFVSGLPFYPFLDSDISVHVYMAQSFSFKHDLYYWGQDRLGSFLPLVSNLIYRISGWSPFWIVAIVKWLILCVGCISFWPFIKSRFMIWAWVVLWFFPVYEMANHLLPGQPYAEQMAFIGLSLVCFHHWVYSTKLFYLPIFLILASTATWISDFSIVVYLTLLVVFWRLIINHLPVLIKKENRLVLGMSMLSLGLGAGFLLYAKLSAPRDLSYTMSPFASYDQFFHSIVTVFTYFTKCLVFQSISVGNSIAVYSTLFLIAFYFVFRRHTQLSKWSVFFFCNVCVGFLFILSLRWLAINYVMLKYFIPVFFILWLTLISVDITHLLGWKKWVISGCVFLICAGSVGSLLSIYNKLYHVPRISYQDLNTAFFKEPKYIIGNYWNSYVLGCVHPENIVATPSHFETVRHPRPVERVLQSDTVYACLNDWFEITPDTLEQFHHQFILIESEIEEGRFRFAKYKNLGRSKKD